MCTLIGVQGKIEMEMEMLSISRHRYSKNISKQSSRGEVTAYVYARDRA